MFDLVHIWLRFMFLYSIQSVSDARFPLVSESSSIFACVFLRLLMSSPLSLLSWISLEINSVIFASSASLPDVNSRARSYCIALQACLRSASLASSRMNHLCISG